LITLIKIRQFLTYDLNFNNNNNNNLGGKEFFMFLGTRGGGV